MPEFTHLHLHTEYSLLDGTNKKKVKIKKANLRPNLAPNIRLWD